MLLKKDISVWGLWFLTTMFFLLAPPNWLGEIPYQKFDKVSHIVLFIVGTYIAINLAGKKGILIMLFVALGSEWLQGLSPSRTMSALDAVSNLIGVAIGVTVCIAKGLFYNFVFDKRKLYTNNFIDEKNKYKFDRS